MNSRLALAASSAALALPAPLHAVQTTWIVDADGGGDFAELQSAIDAAAPGDVLRIEPADSGASYGPALLDKALDLIGDPSLVPHLEALDVQGAMRVTLFHLDLDRLRIQGVPGPAIVDACEVGGGSSSSGPDWSTPAAYAKFVVVDSADVRIGRSLLRGSETVPNAWGRPALDLRGTSSAQVVDSQLDGADVPASDLYSGWGGDALQVQDTARVLVTGCSLRGGDGANLWAFGFLDELGRGGNAVSVLHAAEVDLRGGSGTVLVGGLQNGLDTQGPSPAPTQNGLAVDCLQATSAAVALSGVLPQSPVAACAATVAEPRPYLALGAPPASGTLGPVAGPGDARSAELYGTAGAPAFLIGSLGADQVSVASLETTPLWLQLALVLEVTATTLSGIDTPRSFHWTLPAQSAFSGVEYHLQAFELLPAQTLRGTNAGVLVLSF